MAEQWEPGDVARRVGRDGTEATSVVVQADRSRIYCHGDHGPDMHWHHSNGGWNALDEDPKFGTYRRLVVIDPSDWQQMERLLDAYNDADPHPEITEGQCGSGSCWIGRMQAALREFANPTPPKPDEPTGLGAVVEDADGVKWVRFKSWAQTPWRQGHMPGGDTEAVSAYYRDIDVVRVLSEGVQP